MSIHNYFKEKLKKIGFKISFEEYHSAIKEIEMMGAYETVQEYEWPDNELNEVENKKRLMKNILATLYFAEIQEEFATAGEWLLETYEEWFTGSLVKLTRIGHYNLFSIFSDLSNDEFGHYLSHHEADGYITMHRIANLIHHFHDYSEESEFITKQIRDAGCDVTFDSYGDYNTTLILIGHILCTMENYQELPSLEVVKSELRECSSTNLNHLNKEGILSAFDESINLEDTIFDKDFWEGCEKSLALFEKAINEILNENDKKELNENDKENKKYYKKHSLKIAKSLN